MECYKCHKKFKDKYIHRHHLFPIHLGGSDNDGTIYLCDRCHREIHDYIDTLEYIKKQSIIDLTNKWLKNELITKKLEKLPLCPKCKNLDCRTHILNVGSNYLILMCSHCGYISEKNYELYDWYYKTQLKKISKDNKKLLFKKIGVEDGDGISEV